MSHLLNQFQALPQKKQNAIRKFCETYNQAGYECFLVGGSCRDLWLGKEPKDFDFASNCPLSVTKSLFPKVKSTGEPHGTLTVIFSGFQFEVTRYRKDVSTDGRRATITFAETIEEDQQRRDLRLNTLAYDVLTDRVIDSQAAIRDFKEKIIRFVGTAQDRIYEDHLRALRYGRMILTLEPLGFSYLHDEMKQVVRVFDIDVLSVERIFDELNMMLAINPRNDQFLGGFLKNLRIFNRFDIAEDQTELLIQSILESGSLIPLWYSYYKVHGLSETAKTMRLSRQNKRLIRLTSEYEKMDLSSEIVIKRLLRRAFGIDREQLLISIKHLLKKDIRILVQKMIENKHPLYIRDLVINGNDLKTIDIKGRRIGLTLEYLLESVWKRPQINRVKTLMKLAADYQRELDD